MTSFQKIQRLDCTLETNILSYPILIDILTRIIFLNMEEKNYFVRYFLVSIFLFYFRISMSVRKHLVCANIPVSTRGGVTSVSVNLDSN